MKTAKDFYYQELFSLSDKPVNLLNPDRNKDAPINSSNDAEAIVEETARMDYEGYLLCIGKHLMAKALGVLLIGALFFSAITSLIFCIKIDFPNPDWQKYVSLYVLAIIPSFDIGVAFYRPKVRKDEMYFNLHSTNFLPEYSKMVSWDNFLEDLRSTALLDECLSPFLSMAEKIKFPRRGTRTHSHFYQKKLAEKVSSCPSYEETQIIPTLLSIFVLLASLILQFCLFINEIHGVDPNNLQRMVRVVVFPISLAVVFGIIGFLYGACRFKHELTVLGLSYIYDGYCNNSNVKWYRVGTATNVKDDNLKAYLSALRYDAETSGIHLLNCQIRISFIEGERVIETTSEKDIDKLSGFILAQQNMK